MLRPFLYYLLIFSFFTNAAFSKGFPLLHYTTADGIPSNCIYDIYRDSKGFIWFCTDNGVACYNGIKFENFNTYDGLPDNEIFSIQEDKYYRLWLMTYNGALCYYKDGTFHTALNTPFLRLPFSSSDIGNINPENDSSVTLFFGDRQYFVNIQRNKIHIYPLKEINKKCSIIQLKAVEKISPDKYGLFCNDKYLVIDTNLNVLSVKKYNGNTNMVYVKQQDTVYLCDSLGAYYKGEKIFSFTKNFLSKYHIYKLYYDSNVFIGTNYGLFINNDIHIFNSHKVSSITKDNDGNYWISTLDNGVYKLSRNIGKVQKFENVYQGKVTAMKTNDSHIYFSTDNSMLYDFNNGCAKQIFNYSNHTRSLNSLTSSAYLIDDNYNYYNFNKGDNFIVSAINTAHPLLRYYKNIFLRNSVKAIYPTVNGFYIKYPANMNHITFFENGHYYENQTFIKSANPIGRIFATSVDAEHAVWFSTLTNIYKIINDTAIPQPQFKTLSFKWLSIVGSYFIGNTLNNKLFICNMNGKDIFIDSIKQKCIWDNSFVLDKNHILITTNDLYRILTLYPSNGAPKYSVTVIENVFVPTQAEYVCKQNDLCYFFKNRSITSISLDDLLFRSRPPAVFFKLLKIKNGSYPIEHSLTVSYEKARNISIEFSIISPISKNINCEYSISRDSSDNWTLVKNEEISLFNPRYGRYIIKVRASTLSSNYSTPATFILIIKKPYWATWWFITFCCLTIIISVALISLIITKYFLQKRIKEHEGNVRILRSEYKAANALMNPHFVFNTLNNVQGLITDGDKLSAHKYIRVFSDLIRQNMHNVSLELIPLQKEVDLIINYLKLEKLRFKDWFEYEIKIEEHIDMTCIMVPPLLIQPLVENAIKHGVLPLQLPDSLVSIHIYLKSDKIYIEVKDNGVGIEYAQYKMNKYESFGLRNVKKRIEQLRMMYEKEFIFEIYETMSAEGKIKGTTALIMMELN